MTADLCRLLDELDALEAALEAQDALPLKVWDRGIGWEIHRPDGFPLNSGDRETFSAEAALFVMKICNAYPLLRDALRKGAQP